jgi:hypothetical protein
MLKFQCNFCLVKGRIVDFESSTYIIKDGVSAGDSTDKDLESQHKYIIPVLEKMLKNNPKIDKKGFRWIDTSGKKPKAKNVNKVYFVEIEEARWLESGSFKGEVNFIIKESKINSFEFKRIGQTQVKDDDKSLKRPDKKEKDEE